MSLMKRLKNPLSKELLPMGVRPRAVMSVLTCCLLVACAQPQTAQQVTGAPQTAQLAGETASTAAPLPTVEQQIYQLVSHINAMSRMLETLGTEVTEIKAQQAIQERDTARINGIADSMGLLHRKINYVEKKIRAMEIAKQSEAAAQDMYYGEGDISNLEQEMEAALSSPSQIEQAPKTSPLASNFGANSLEPELHRNGESVAARNQDNLGQNGLDVDALLALGDERPALHIASLQDLSRVGEAWDELQRTYPNQLSDLDWRLSVVDLPGKGRYYRIKAGPLRNFEQAQQRCNELKSQRKYCKVVDFTGTRP